jgi:PAS domain-containing protein
VVATCAEQEREAREHTPNGGDQNLDEARPDWEPSVSGSGREMSERIREFEWEETPLGPMAEWPQELRTAVDIMLGAEEAIGIYWGEDLILLYNDGARDLIGEKHPGALGRPAREVFAEAWETLGPLHEQVMAGDGAASIREYLLPLKRSDELEDIWFDSSYNPIPGPDGSVGGVFNVAVDVTDRVRAGQDLRESNERLEVALNAAGMGTWEWDLDERTVRSDEQMLSLFDLPPTDDPVPVERFLEKESAAGAAQAEEAMEASFEPGEKIQDQFHLENIEPPRWITWRGRAAEDDPSVLRGVSFDITSSQPRVRQPTVRMPSPGHRLRN